MHILLHFVHHSRSLQLVDLVGVRSGSVMQARGKLSVFIRDGVPIGTDLELSKGRMLIWDLKYGLKLCSQKHASFATARLGVPRDVYFWRNDA